MLDIAQVSDAINFVLNSLEAMYELSTREKLLVIRLCKSELECKAFQEKITELSPS